MAPFQDEAQTMEQARRGAAHGRPSTPRGELSGKVSLRRVPISGGGYDPGGAYWGMQRDPLFCAWNEAGAFYFNARNRDVAKASLLKAHPAVTL